MTDSIPIIIDGKELQVAEGTWLIEACKQAGFDVPHYCYHEGLSVSGNCRMCIVKVEQMPKPVTSCTIRVQMQRVRGGGVEPMRVITHDDELTAIRRSVMEFLLINHPLDCPQCDKAGECSLQNYAYTYGRDASRFIDDKTVRHTKTLGDTVRIWGNRCIACSRCVRFTNEISGTGELTLINRGNKNVIDIFPGRPLDNPLSLNVVDVCPVGALQSRSFLYSARSWFLDKVETILPNARGDNAIVESQNGKLKRIRPRFNPDVNDWWLADRDRLGFEYVHQDRTTKIRIGDHAATLAESVAAIADELNQISRDRLAVVASAWMTNEELFLVRQLVGNDGPLSGARVIVSARPDHELTWNNSEATTLRLEADDNPNRIGVELILGDAVGSGGGKITFDDDGSELARIIRHDRISHVLLLGRPPRLETTDELRDALGDLVWLAAGSAWADDAYDLATVKLPTVSTFEKTGSFTSNDGRVQRLNPAIPAPEGAVDDIALLQAITRELTRSRNGGGRRDGTVSLPAAGVFANLARTVPAYGDLTHTALGAYGRPIEAAKLPR